VGNNTLQGPIPSSLGALVQMTGALHLRYNSLSGTIPPQLYSLTQLTHFELQSNHFNGGISTYIGNLKKLFLLRLDDNSLTGPLPTELGLLLSLTSLELGNNRLVGSIPTQLGSLTSLTYVLNLGTNSLQYSVPSSIYNLVNLQRLDLHANALIGITGDVGNMNALTALQLSYNSFGGMIPPKIGDLINLQVLELNHNLFSGGVPIAFCNLVNLVVLNLCDGSSGNAGCEYLTSVPDCVYNAPSSSLSHVTTKHIGVSVSVTPSSASKTQDGVTIAVLSVVFCLCYLLVLRYLYVAYTPKAKPRLAEAEPINDV
jgi:Leucine-rich repeat (LRR) protein